MSGLHEARGSQSTTSQEGTVESEASDSCGHSSGYKSSSSSQASYDGSDTVRKILIFMPADLILVIFFTSCKATAFSEYVIAHIKVFQGMSLFIAN